MAFQRGAYQRGAFQQTAAGDLSLTAALSGSGLLSGTLTGEGAPVAAGGGPRLFIRRFNAPVSAALSGSGSLSGSLSGIATLSNTAVLPAVHLSAKMSALISLSALLPGEGMMSISLHTEFNSQRQRQKRAAQHAAVYLSRFTA
jgi:hypothetical protein